MFLLLQVLPSTTFLEQLTPRQDCRKRKSEIRISKFETNSETDEYQAGKIQNTESEGLLF